jgi:hypothetical protein
MGAVEPGCALLASDVSPTIDGVGLTGTVALMEVWIDGVKKHTQTTNYHHPRKRPAMIAVQSRARRGTASWLWRKVVVSFRNLRHLWNWCLAVGLADVLFTGDKAGVL